MNRISARHATVLSHIVAFAGGIVLTQGFSFGRWHESDIVGDKLNEHAYLIGGCGIGVFLAGVVLHHVLTRIDALEEKAKDSSGGDHDRATR